ncbi:MAG: lipase family protein [Treponema sp.]|nr:lipase family protein [Treponema sp.]
MRPFARILAPWLSFAAVFAAGNAAGAESHSVTFPVKSLVTATEKPVPLEAAWDESWFCAKPATAYHHGIARIACILSAASYDAVDAASFTDSLSLCYSALGFSRENIDYHYDVDYADPVWGNDQCAFSFARREIQTAGGKRTLVCVVIRGTPLNANEWISNLDIGATSSENSVVTMHSGFTRATQQVLTAFYTYLLENHIDMSRACFLVTGHSRGAAVANLLGSLLIQNRLFTPENLYVYTFATPNVTTDKDASSEKYGFIWNIINEEDIVPTVPLSRNRWQFTKYGRCRAMVNYWNADPALYAEKLFPRVNSVYQKLLLRNYEPFGTGPFIPVQVTRMLSQMNKNVASYYSGALGLHNKAERLMRKVFSGDRNILEYSTQDSPLLGTWLNSATDGLLGRLSFAALDMHANEMYLANMLSLEEDELFSTMGSSQLVISGSFEGAVFDKDGNVLVQILDNRVVYKSITLPAAALQLTPASLVIGLPGNADFTVVLYHSSLVPTPVSVRLEQYDAGGILRSVEEKRRVYLHKGMAYRFSAGRENLAQHMVEPEKIKGAVAGAYIKKADLSSIWDVNLLFETGMNSNWVLSGGIQLGAPALFGTALVSHRSNALYDTLQLTAGLGTRQTLWGAVQLETEGLCHFVQDFDTPFSNDDDESGFYFVPSVRFSLALKPRRRVLFFGAASYDFCIDGFNERAFDNALRHNSMHGLALSSSVKAVPSFQFGIRF